LGRARTEEHRATSPCPSVKVNHSNLGQTDFLSKELGIFRRWFVEPEKFVKEKKKGALHRDQTRKAGAPHALQAVGDDPNRQPHSESPISVDISAFGVGFKKPQRAICDRVKLLRAKMMDMRAIALPKDDQRRVAHLSRRKDVLR